MVNSSLIYSADKPGNKSLLQQLGHRQVDGNTDIIQTFVILQKPANLFKHEPCDGKNMSGLLCEGDKFRRTDQLTIRFPQADQCFRGVEFTGGHTLDRLEPNFKTVHPIHSTDPIPQIASSDHFSTNIPIAADIALLHVIRLCTGIFYIFIQFRGRGLQSIGHIVHQHVVRNHLLVHAQNTVFQKLQQFSALALSGILVGVTQDNRKDGSVHMKGQAALKQLFQRECKLIKELIAKQMSILLIDRAEILDIDEKNLKWFLFCDAAVHFCEKTMTVVQFCQRMDTLPLSLES